jgi:hypothetical protein
VLLLGKLADDDVEIGVRHGWGSLSTVQEIRWDDVEGNSRKSGAALIAVGSNKL